MALGWYVVSNLLPARSSATSSASVPGVKAAGKRSSRPGFDDGPVVMAESQSLDEGEGHAGGHHGGCVRMGRAWTSMECDSTLA